MFGSKSRQIAALTLRVSDLGDRLDDAIRERDDARSVVTRQAIADTDASVELHRSLDARYRQEISRLSAVVASQDRMINDEMRFADRAVAAPVPTPEIARLRAQVRLLERLTASQQERLTEQQDASEADDQAHAKAVA